jgi:uncharacterized transporter YbjL
MINAIVFTALFIILIDLMLHDTMVSKLKQKGVELNFLMVVPIIGTVYMLWVLFRNRG